ncbi:hypothetical protein T07_10449 [Trichinella nelsoni]|uniref:Uncharacterized protein n=1 Tax=Trichinella nelsoni TaxID=6336 RepID=A0A0V0RJ56_9BILA|nr:hypothetical protein T07_10449 [Trichinella nelsoni]
MDVFGIAENNNDQPPSTTFRVDDKWRMSAVGKISQPKRSDTAAKAKTLLLRGKALLASVVPRIMYRLNSKYDARIGKALSKVKLQIAEQQQQQQQQQQYWFY